MKRGTPRHPKVADLASRLSVTIPTAVGLLELLWHFAAEFAHSGDVGRFTDDAIAKALCWDGPSTVLVSCLTECGWLDRCKCHRLRIHDWPDHADQTVQRVLSKRNQGFIACYDDPSTMLASDEHETSQPLPLPIPIPTPIPVSSEPPARVVAAKPVKGDPWSREACDDWIERFDGTAPGGRIGKAMKPLVGKHGWGDVRPAWRSYLAQTEAEYASPERFAATYGKWAGTVGEPRKLGKVDSFLASFSEDDLEFRGEDAD